MEERKEGGRREGWESGSTGSAVRPLQASLLALSWRNAGVGLMACAYRCSSACIAAVFHPSEALCGIPSVWWLIHGWAFDPPGVALCHVLEKQRPPRALATSASCAARC